MAFDEVRPRWRTTSLSTLGGDVYQGALLGAWARFATTFPQRPFGASPDIP